MVRSRYGVPEIMDEIYVAGQRVAPGVYRLVGGQKEVRLESEDILPATCDGHVAAYVREAPTWADISRLISERNVMN